MSIQFFRCSFPIVEAFQPNVAKLYGHRRAAMELKRQDSAEVLLFGITINHLGDEPPIDPK